MVVSSRGEARGQDPRYAASDGLSGTARQIAELAGELEQRAATRIQIGSLRVLVEDFEEVTTHTSRARNTIFDDRDRQAISQTLRFELESALSNRINVVDGGIRPISDETTQARRARTGATHALVGTYFRAGDSLDVTLRIIDLRDGWIVATAQRRIHRFRPRNFAGGEAPTPGAMIASRREQRAGANAPEPPQSEPLDAGLAGMDEADLELEGVPDGAIEFEEGPAAARLGRGGSRAERGAAPDELPR